MADVWIDLIQLATGDMRMSVPSALLSSQNVRSEETSGKCYDHGMLHALVLA